MKAFFRILVIAALLLVAYYGYQRYQIRVAGEPWVEHQVGERVQCPVCGKILDDSKVETIMAPASDAHIHKIIRVDRLCDECRSKGVQR
jgi:hypothetical protein